MAGFSFWEILGEAFQICWSFSDGVPRYMKSILIYLAPFQHIVYLERSREEESYEC